MTPYTEHRRAMNRLVLEEARKHQTSRCPVCNKREYKVLETRPTSYKGIGQNIRRRRRRCDHCGHRDTTYEIPDFMYRQMVEDRKIVDEIAKSFGFKNKPAFKTSAVEESNVDCDDCRFNDGESCSFDLPEYGTFDCRDCVNFQKGD